jgi:SAM-dependent methyltransferase
MEPLPYIDLLLRELRGGAPEALALLGRHIHLGYWTDPNQADGSVEDFAAAAERLSRLVCEAGGVHDGQRILDVGCGIGGTVASLNEQLTEVDVAGLNIDARQLKVAKQKVAARPGNSVQFVVGNACHLPFAGQAFDLVTAVECSFHFPSRQVFLREARRVLRSGGIVSVSDLVTEDDVPLFGTVRRLLLPSQVRSPFYGKLDLSHSLQDYRAAARTVGLAPVRELDITEQTLPTYPVVLEVMKQRGWCAAYLETCLVRWFSLLRGVRYLVLSYQAT